VGRRRENADAQAAWQATCQAGGSARQEPTMRIDIAMLRLEKARRISRTCRSSRISAPASSRSSGTVTGLSSRTDARAVVDLDGKVDEYAPVNIDGTVNYLAAESFTDLAWSSRTWSSRPSRPTPASSWATPSRRAALGRLSLLVENRKLRPMHNVKLDIS